MCRQTSRGHQHDTRETLDIMCPLYPLHIVLLYLCLILPLLLAVVQGSEELSSAIAAGSSLKKGRLTFGGLESFKTQEQNVSQLQVSHTLPIFCRDHLGKRD